MHIRRSLADIPADPTKGVKLKLENGRTLVIGIPGAQQSGRGVKTNKGYVAYAGKASANAVVPTANGGLQFLTTIASRKAPTNYDYPVTLPKGSKFTLVEGDSTAGVAFYFIERKKQK